MAVIEMDRVGGTCLNRGCRPTKALRASARVAHLVRTAGRHGISTGEVAVDFAAVMRRKDEMIDRWQVGSTESLQHTDNIELIFGVARFDGSDDQGHRVIVAGDPDRVLVAPKVFLNTGTRSAVPGIPGLDDVPWLDNDRVLHLDELPEHLIIDGGSYISLEFGQLFRRFGSKITIVERGQRIASREDLDISTEIARFLTAEGIEILTETTITSVEPTEPGIRVNTTTGSIDGSHLLVAVGRTPNTDRLALDTVGLTVDDRGMIPTDGVFRTAVKGIYALGDINGRGAFTHTSYQDYEIMIDHLGGGDRSADGRIQTYAMFTDPPLGRVGLTETQARATGRPIKIARYAMQDVTRAVLDGETDGTITVVVDAETDRFLGASVLGITGDEIVQIVSALMHAGASYRVLQQLLPVHPTVAEFYPTILETLR